jgi:hypothetical protein
VLSLALVDGTHAQTRRDGWISVEADEPVTDLHITQSDYCLNLSASKPPRQLRLHGGRLARLRAVCLNGRHAQPLSGDRPDSILITGGEWSEEPARP